MNLTYKEIKIAFLFRAVKMTVRKPGAARLVSVIRPQGHTSIPEKDLTLFFLFNKGSVSLRLETTQYYLRLYI
jgi:hypothetical protein